MPCSSPPGPVQAVSVDANVNSFGKIPDRKFKIRFVKHKMMSGESIQIKSSELVGSRKQHWGVQVYIRFIKKRDMVFIENKNKGLYS